MNRQAGDPREVPGPISLCPLSVQDIPFGLQLSTRAGWNQTEADWAMLLEHSTRGSFLACYHGVAAGTVTTVSYPEQLHWLGMMLVAPEIRRRGIGTALLKAAIQAVEGLGVVCLDATPTGKLLYEQLGFQDLYRLGRLLRQPAPLYVQPVHPCHTLSQDMLPTIRAYDLPVFGADRAAILRTLHRNAASLALFVAADQEITGYCLGRVGLKYIQIGPLIADSLEIARDLLLSALQACTHQPVILDIPLEHSGWQQLLADLGFVEQRPFIRMCLGECNLPEQHARQYAIAGPEIG